jgi:hypothetical protein
LSLLVVDDFFFEIGDFHSEFDATSPPEDEPDPELFSSATDGDAFC